MCTVLMDFSMTKVSALISGIKSDWEIVESVKTNESYTLVIMPWIKTKCEMLLINAGKTLTLSIGSKDAHSKTNRVKAALRSN